MRAPSQQIALPGLAAVLLAALLTPAVRAAGVPIAGNLPAEPPGDRSAAPAPVKGRSLAGKVVDEEGRPVAGVRVVLEGKKPVVTGERGEFEVLNPPAGTRSLAVHRQGFAPLLIGRLEIAEKDLRIDLGTLTLRKATIIEGRVADPEGKPIAGAKVIAATLAAVVMDRFKELMEENPGAAVTDAEGRFRLRELHPRERVNVYVQRDGYVTAVLRAIPASAGKPLDIVLQPEVTISGRVIDEAGEPVPNATVRWLPQTPKGDQDLRGTTATGADGSFSLDKLDPGPARLSAAAKERGAAEIDLTLEAAQNRKDVVITLRTEGPALEGKVFDGQGRPVAGASVHVLLVMPLPNRGSVTTDESGHFRLEGLLLGETTVIASSPQDFGPVRRPVHIQPGRNEIDLAFPPGHPVSGRVLDDQGAPVAGISIRIDSTDRGIGGCQSTTAADGSFITCELPDGSYRIRAWAEEKGGTSWVPVQVSGGSVTDLELQLQRLGRIIGRIRGLDPEQLLWLRVGAFEVRGSDAREGRIGQDGRYEISSLLSGSWELRLIDTQAPLPPAGTRPGVVLGTVILEPGVGEAVVDFDLPREIESRIE